MKCYSSIPRNWFYCFTSLLDILTYFLLNDSPLNTHSDALQVTL